MAENARRQLRRAERAVDQNPVQRGALPRAQAPLRIHPRRFQRLGTLWGHCGVCEAQTEIGNTNTCAKSLATKGHKGLQNEEGSHRGPKRTEEKKKVKICLSL